MLKEQEQQQHDAALAKKDSAAEALREQSLLFASIREELSSRPEHTQAELVSLHQQLDDADQLSRRPQQQQQRAAERTHDDAVADEGSVVDDDLGSDGDAAPPSAPPVKAMLHGPSTLDEQRRHYERVALEHRSLHRRNRRAVQPQVAQVPASRRRARASP